MDGHAGKDDRLFHVDLPGQQLQPLRVIDDKVAHAVLLLGGPGRAAQAHGNHKIAGSAGAVFADESDLWQGGTVKIGNAGLVHQTHDCGVVVGFDRVEDTARKASQKALSGIGIDVGIDTIDGHFGLPGMQ